MQLPMLLLILVKPLINIKRHVFITSFRSFTEVTREGHITCYHFTHYNVFGLSNFLFRLTPTKSYNEICSCSIINRNRLVLDATSLPLFRQVK